MSITEQVIMDRLLGRKLTEDEADVLTSIDILVQHNIFCPMTGRVLDSRSGVLIRQHGRDQTVIDPGAVDEARTKLAHLDGITFHEAAPLITKLGIGAPRKRGRR